MKKVLSLALVAALMLGTVVVKAEAKQTDLVKLYDFNSIGTGVLDDAGLSELGITSVTDGIVSVSIEDFSAEERGNVLKYAPITKGGSIKFPIDYELNTNEKVIVEYDFRVDYNETITEAVSSNFGTIGLFPMKLVQSGKQQPQLDTGKNSGYSPRFYSEALTSGDWYKITAVCDYASYISDSTTGLSFSYTNENGKTTTKTGPLMGTTVDDLLFDNISAVATIYLDNVRVHTLPNFVISDSSVEDGASDVFYDTRTVTATLSNEVVDFSTVSVFKDGVLMEKDVDFSVSATENIITVTFAENLTYSANYEIDFAGVTDVYGQVYDGISISFSVEEEPDIRLGKLKLTKGIGASVEEISGLTAVDGLQTISLELENLKSETRNVNVILAIYEGENSRLSSINTLEAVIAANEKRTVSVGVNMADMQGKIVKAFVWDTFTTMKPWFGHTQLEIK